MVTTVPALRAIMSLDAEGVQTTLRTAEGAIKSSAARMNRSFALMQKGFGRVGKSIGRDIAGLARRFVGFNAVLGAVAGTAGLGLLIKRSVDSADAIGKTADKIGFTTDALQELRFAADLTGVSQQTLDLALQRFSRRVGEAIQGTGELKDTLKQYNIQLRDSHGQVRSIDAVLQDYAQAVAGAESEQEQLRLAFKGFDSEGAALVNLLRRGGAGMSQLRSEARRLGLVLDESLIRSAESTKDQLSILGSVISTNVSRAVLQLAPQLGDLAKRFSEGIPVLVQWIGQFGEFIGLLEKNPAERLAELREEIAKLNQEIAATPEQPLAMGMEMFATASGAPERLRSAKEQEKALLRQMHAGGSPLAKFPGAAGAATAAPSPSVIPAVPKPVARPDEGAKAFMETQRAVAALSAELDPAGAAIGNYRERVDLLNQGLEQGAISAERHQQLMAALNREFVEGGENAEAAAEKQQFLADAQARAAQVIEATRTPQEQYNARVAELNELLRQGAIDQETYRRAVVKANEDLTIAGRATEDLANSISGTLNDAIRGNIQSWGDLGQAAIGEITRIIDNMIRLQTTMALTGGTGGGGILGGILGPILNFGAGPSGGVGAGTLAASGAGVGTGLYGARAAGGPVMPDKPYLVGERGPEIIVPRKPGIVIPNHVVKSRERSARSVASVSPPTAEAPSQAAPGLRAAATTRPAHAAEAPSQAVPQPHAPATKQSARPPTVPPGSSSSETPTEERRGDRPGSSAPTITVPPANSPIRISVNTPGAPDLSVLPGALPRRDRPAAAAGSAPGSLPPRAGPLARRSRAAVSRMIPTPTAATPAGTRRPALPERAQRLGADGPELFVPPRAGRVIPHRELRRARASRPESRREPTGRQNVSRRAFLQSALAASVTLAAISPGAPMRLSGARATGGAVAAGGAYLTGERGDELFMPHMGAIAVPPRAAGTGVVINQSFDLRGAEPGVFARFQVERERLKGETISAVQALLDAGGGFAKAAGRRR